MTYQPDQVQSLIAEIDRVLRKTQSWKPWSIFLRARLQRKMLERVRNFLVIQHKPGPIAAPKPPEAAGAMAPPLTQPILSAVAQEIDHLRTRAILPLQADITQLSQQRETLLQEVRALEQQKAALQAASSTLSAVELSDVTRLQAMRDRTDHLLSSMDSSLHMAFSSLQRNLQTYQDSLANSIDRMHSLGYQGEVMFSTLVNHWAEQLGREASSYLSSRPSSEVTAPVPAASGGAGSASVEQPLPPETILPFPGTEIAAVDRQPAPGTPSLIPPPAPSPVHAPVNAPVSPSGQAKVRPPVSSPASATTSPPVSFQISSKTSPNTRPQGRSTAATPAPAPSTQVDTIHRLDDLLQEISAAAPISSQPVPEPPKSGTTAVPARSEDELTLTGMDDLFESVPAVEATNQVTMETLFGEFAEAPETVPTESAPAQRNGTLGATPPSKAVDRAESYDLTLEEINALFE